MSSNQINTLKAAFIEFFRKILPMIEDPDGAIKDRWNKFRMFLLNESNTIGEIYEYVKKLPYGQESKPKSQNESPIKSRLTKREQKQPRNDEKKEERKIEERKKEDTSQNGEKKEDGTENETPVKTFEPRRVPSTIRNKPNKAVQLHVLKEIRYLSKQFDSDTKSLDTIYYRSHITVSPRNQDEKKKKVELEYILKKPDYTQQLRKIEFKKKKIELKDFSVYAGRNGQKKPTVYEVDKKIKENEEQYKGKLVI